MDKVRDENLESEPLCPTPGEDGAKMPISKFRHQQKRHLYLVYILIAAYVPSIILYIWLAVSYLRLRNQSTELDLFPSLARSSAVRKDNRVFSLTVANSPFAGDPSPKLDQAWHDLLEGVTFRVPKEDLDYYNVTSLPLADGSGYATEMFMTHELHCLKKVRQWIYEETYFADVQGLPRNELKRHIDHCIETLRQGVMCRGDVSLATYTYLKGTADVTARTWSKHQCVDYDALSAWVRERAIDIFEEGVLTKPEDLDEVHFTERKQPHR